jgi:hypothetical protein
MEMERCQEQISDVYRIGSELSNTVAAKDAKSDE